MLRIHLLLESDGDKHVLQWWRLSDAMQHLRNRFIFECRDFIHFMTIILNENSKHTFID